MRKNAQNVTRKKQRISAWLMPMISALLPLSLLLLSGCTLNSGKKPEPEIRFIDRVVEVERPAPLPYVDCELPRPDLTDYRSFSDVLTQNSKAVESCNEINRHASEYNMKMSKKAD